MNKKRILHIIDSLAVGGAEMLLVNTINSLIDYYHTIVILSNNNDFKDVLFLKNKNSVNFISKGKTFKAIFDLRKILKENRIEIIHSHLFWSTLIARIACIGLNIKFIFSLHTVMSKDSFNNSKLMKWIEKFTYTKNQIVIAVSNTVLNDYDKIIGLKGKRHVLYNFVDNSFFLPIDNHKKKVLSNMIKLVAVGNIKPVKNYNYLLDVFKNIDNSKFSLDIYGIGDGLITLKNLVDKYELNITFKGSSNQLASILPCYDAYIMPSLYEGFGVAPLEAMASGLPVLLSDIPVFREIANDEALFFDPNKKSDLIEILNRIFRKEVNLTVMSKKGRKKAEQISKKENYLKKINAIYLE